MASDQCSDSFYSVKNLLNHTLLSRIQIHSMRFDLIRNLLMQIKKVRHFIGVLLWDEEAQGTVEYILILSVVVVGASQLIKQIIQSIDKGVLRLGGDLEKDLKTGRTPVSVFRN